MNNFKEELLNEIGLNKTNLIEFKKLAINQKLNVKPNFIDYLFPNRFYLSTVAKFGDMKSSYLAMTDVDSKRLFIKLLVSKLLGHELCQNKIQNPEWIEKLNSCIRNHSDLLVRDEVLPLFNLSSLGFQVLFNTTLNRILETDIHRMKECLKSKSNSILDFDKGYGESSILFSFLAQSIGNVYTYVENKEHLAIVSHNINLNPHLSRNIKILNSSSFDSVEHVDLVKVDISFFQNNLNIIHKLLMKFRPKWIIKFVYPYHDTTQAISLLNEYSKKYQFSLLTADSQDVILLAT